MPPPPQTLPDGPCALRYLTEVLIYTHRAPVGWGHWYDVVCPTTPLPPKKKQKQQQQQQRQRNDENTIQVGNFFTEHAEAEGRTNFALWCTAASHRRGPL